MQRYTVTLVHPAFIDELFKRIAKQGLKLAPNTHIATLHLDSETADSSQAPSSTQKILLSDVVTDPKSEKIFAVFAEKQTSEASAELISQQLATSSLGASGERLLVRFVTAALANKDRATIAPVSIALSATIKQLHELAAHHLELSVTSKNDKCDNECNCTLAKQLADGPGDSTYFFLIHGKSIVKRIPLGTFALQAELGLDVLTNKKIARHGAELRASGFYAKLPVVAVCEKARHVPIHARLHSEDSEENSQLKFRAVDLHTSEQPISAESMGITLSEAALGSLVQKDGIIDIFVVNRNRSTAHTTSSKIGTSALFRARPHWEPREQQTTRGVAMFLFSPRVFASIASESDKRNQDAILHVVDLMARFPPCTRAMALLIERKTTSAEESAAVADAMYELLHHMIIPSGIVGTDTTHVFEGSRLLLGFILEKARSLKLSPSSASEDQLPYLTAMQIVDLKDCKTGEPVFQVVRTADGLIEKSLVSAFESGGALEGTHLQWLATPLEVTESMQRNAVLAGGATDTLLVYKDLTSYVYVDAGNLDAAIDMSELSRLEHLAEVAARHQLAVHRPSQLASAVANSLTFDRGAHLAVYLGEQGCGSPVDSSLVFRPRHGNEQINRTVVEQLIDPIIKQYESEGTAVFDSYGGALLRRLQAPEEILFFCVDTSASMRASTDFREIHDHDSVFREPELTAASLVDVDEYANASFDQMKDFLANYEGFNDMIGIVKDGQERASRVRASRALQALRGLLGQELVSRHQELEQAQELPRGYYGIQRASTLDKAVKDLKFQWAGLQSQEEALQDFLVYRATTSPDINAKWQWSLCDAVPASRPANVLSTLPAQLTEVPDQSRCPISHALMEDPVKAANGFMYSRPAIEQWFKIRLSSPMTGLPLQSRTLSTNDAVAAAVANWVSGTDLQEVARPPAKKTRLSSSKRIAVTFLSKDGSFEREITNGTTVSDLYSFAFRAMKACSVVFQLALDDATTLQPSDVLATAGSVTNGTKISVRVADDMDMASSPTTVAASSNAAALVKVYRTNSNILFSYWVDRNAPQTLSSILWKYWRHTASNHAYHGSSEQVVWVDMRSNGDGYTTGSPREATEQLNRYLTVGHCHGKLGDEPVWREDDFDTVSSSQPLVLKVKINDRISTSSRAPQLSRLDVLKRMFEAYINRMVAYNYKSHVGLITFDSSASVKTSVTHVIENFRRATVDMEADGDTALWDALALGSDQLNEFAKKYPMAKKRIVVISDGEDTKSVSNNAASLTFDLRAHNIIVDSVAVGGENSITLRMLSQLTGGYRFKPTSLVNALSMVEMEAFLSLTERPDAATFVSPAVPKNRAMFEMFFHRNVFSATTTTVTSDSYLSRKTHDNLGDDFMQLATASTRPAAAAQSSGRNNFRITRLMKEMARVLTVNEERMYDVYISESDMTFWKIVMQGPVGSPYEGGTFLVYVHAGESCPTFAPEARFVTRMMHPNINAHGRICHALLSRDWTSDTSMVMLLDTVFGLLMQAEVGDASNTLVLDYHHDQVDFADEVRKHVSKHAKKTRAQWKKELVGED